MADGDGAQGQEPGAGATGTGQEPTGQQTGQQTPQAGAEGQQGGQQGQPGQQQTPDLSTITDPALRGWVEAQARQAAEARQEAARYRTDLRTVQEQMQQFRQQHETDEQRAQREAAERQERLTALEAENRLLKVTPQFNGAAQAAKALDPAALLTLVGGLSAIQLDEQGKATNLDALISAARTKYPFMFGRTDADAQQGVDGQPPAGGGMNDFIRGRANAR